MAINQDIIIRVKFLIEDIQKGVRTIETNVNQINTSIQGMVKQTQSAFNILFGDLEKGYKNFRTTAENFAKLLRAEFRWILGFEVIRAIENSFRFALNSIVEFDYALAKVQASTLATNEEMKELATSLLRIAQRVPYSFKELGEAMAIIVRAGISAKEVPLFLETASKLALITGEKLEKVAEFLVSVQKVYQFSASELPQVANTIAVALNKSKLALKDFIVSWQYIAPTAKTANLSIKEIAALMMVLADKGLDASKIGTNLRQAMTYLIAPTTKLRQVFEQYGLTIDEVNILNHNLIDVLLKLQEKGIGVYEVFQGLGIRGATAFAYLLTSLNDIRNAMAELAIADTVNILDRATGYMINTIRSSLLLLKNEIAVTSTAFTDLIKPGVINTVTGFVQVLRVLQASFTTLNTILQNQAIQYGILTAGIVGLLRYFTQWGSTLLVIRGSAIGFLIALADLTARLFGIRQGLLSANEAIWLLIMGITALKARVSGLARALLIVEGIAFALEKIGDIVRRQTGTPFVGAVADFTANINKLLKAENIEEYRSALFSLRNAWKEIGKDLQNQAPTLHKVFTQPIEASYQTIQQNREKIIQELPKVLSAIDQEITKYEQKRKELMTKLEVGKELDPIRKRLIQKQVEPTNIQQEMKTVETNIELLKRMKENLNIVIQSLALSQQNVSNITRRTFKDFKDFKAFFDGYISDLKQVPTHLDEIKEGYKSLFAETAHILKKYRITVPAEITQRFLQELEKAKSPEALKQIYTRYLQEIKPPQEALGELAKAVIQTLGRQDVAKAFQAYSKEMEKLGKKSRETAEQIALLREEIQQLLETEPYGIDYFNRLLQSLTKLEKILGKPAQELRQSIFGQLKDFLSSEEVRIAPRELVTLYQLLAGSTFLGQYKEDIFALARESFKRYIETMVTGSREIISVINFMLKHQNTVQSIFKQEGIQDIVSTLTSVVQKEWAEGLLTEKQIETIRQRYKTLTKEFGIDFLTAFDKALINTIFPNFEIFFKNLQILIKLFGRDSEQTLQSIQNNLTALVSITSIEEAKKAFQIITENFTRFRDVGIDISKLYNNLIDNTINLYNTNKATLPQIIDLWTEFARTLQNSAQASEQVTKETVQNFQTLILEKLNTGLKEGTLSLNEFTRLLKNFLSLPLEAPNYRTFLDMLRQSGQQLLTFREALHEKLQKETLNEEELKTVITQLANVDGIINKIMEHLRQFALEGKVSFEEVMNILRQFGPLGQELINNLTTSLTPYQQFILSIRDTMLKISLDTKTNVEYMTEAFTAMTFKLRDAFTNTFVKIMQGDIQSLKDLWLSFVTDIVRIWMEALARMAVARLIQWLAPQFTGFLGGILGGIPAVRFQYGGVAPKTPTVGILERGERVLTPQQNTIFEQALEKLANLNEATSTASNIQIVNVIDPKMFSEYLASSQGQKMILNVISYQAPKIRKLLTS